MVENYFSASGTLPAEYWMGIMREGSSNPFTYVTGQLVSSNVSMATHTCPSVHLCLRQVLGIPAVLIQGASVPMCACCCCLDCMRLQQHQHLKADQDLCRGS
jgi:hypothetical protein